MIKYILPAIIVLLIVVFWEKITEVILKKFNIRLNYIIVSVVLITITIIIQTVRLVNSCFNLELDCKKAGRTNNRIPIMYNKGIS